jgi:small GTP-binding protein
MSAPSSANEADVIYKILLLGDTTVGKTCFLMRFTEGTFQEIHMSTIGLDYRLKIMPLDDGKKAKVQIWDTAGQDRFRAITKNYYKGAHGIILIFDVCNVETFENVRNWVTQIRENSSEKATIFLIGNKIDDEIRRKVSKDDGKKLADEFKLQYFETSAKADINVTETFNALTQEIHKKMGGTTKNSGEKLTKGDNNDKKGCCKS